MVYDSVEEERDQAWGLGSPTFEVTSPPRVPTPPPSKRRPYIYETTLLFFTFILFFLTGSMLRAYLPATFIIVSIISYLHIVILR